jgi:hypothetical protein
MAVTVDCSSRRRTSSPPGTGVEGDNGSRGVWRSAREQSSVAGVEGDNDPHIGECDDEPHIGECGASEADGGRWRSAAAAVEWVVGSREHKIREGRRRRRGKHINIRRWKISLAARQRGGSAQECRSGGRHGRRLCGTAR